MPGLPAQACSCACVQVAELRRLPAFSRRWLQIFDELRKVGKRHDLSAGLLIGGKDVKEEQDRVHGESGGGVPLGGALPRPQAPHPCASQFPHRAES